MEQPLARIDPAILALMHGSFGKDGALKPFAREIMLIECQIAGMIPRDVKTVEPQLVPGALLPLKREPENPHDPLAIMVFNEAGHHLGYVPRQNRSPGTTAGRGQTAVCQTGIQIMAGRLSESRGAHLSARFLIPRPPRTPFQIGLQVINRCAGGCHTPCVRLVLVNSESRRPCRSMGQGGQG